MNRRLLHPREATPEGEGAEPGKPAELSYWPAPVRDGQAGVSSAVGMPQEVMDATDVRAPLDRDRLYRDRDRGGPSAHRRKRAPGAKQLARPRSRTNVTRTEGLGRALCQGEGRTLPRSRRRPLVLGAGLSFRSSTGPLSVTIRSPPSLTMQPNNWPLSLFRSHGGPQERSRHSSKKGRERMVKCILVEIHSFGTVPTVVAAEQLPRAGDPLQSPTRNPTHFLERDNG